MQRPFQTNGHLCKPFPSNLPQQLFQTIHIIKATPALSWTKSNHIQHNPYRCHSTIIASHYFHFNLSIHFQPYHSLTFKKSQMLSPNMCKCHSIPMATSVGSSYPIYLNNSSKQSNSITQLNSRKSIGNSLPPYPNRSNSRSPLTKQTGCNERNQILSTHKFVCSQSSPEVTVGFNWTPTCHSD